MKYKLQIEYDGTPFIGWQKQKNCMSIQQTLETAIKKFSNELVTVYGSSRTDAGVHALCQIAHFSLSQEFSCHTIQNAINFHLIAFPISVTNVTAVNVNFHARFDATERHYKYRIINRNAKLTLEMYRAWCVFKPLSIEKMISAAQQLIGKHNFNSFRSSACQSNNPIRTINTIKISKNEALIEINIVARSFLHSQVRIIVGTLKEIGEGKKLDIKQILETKNRRNAGTTAPPHGLYLMEVVTPTGFEPVLLP